MAYSDIFKYEPNDLSTPVMLDIDLLPFDFTGFSLNSCGIEESRPHRKWGPGIRSNYHFHFIFSGKGVFKNAYGEFEVKKNQGFFFAPGEVISYKPDSSEPWTYAWIGFNSDCFVKILETIGISSKKPIFDFDEKLDLLAEFSCLFSLKTGREYYCVSILYKFFSSLFAQTPMKSETVAEQAVKFISNNISSEMNINVIANKFGYSQKYFSSIFKKEVGVTPKKYIIDLKMQTAYDLLKSNRRITSITEIANSVGYSNLLAFSKAFKSHWGSSPTDIMKNFSKGNMSEK